MAYTLKQLTMAWTAVHDGIAPNSETTANLALLTNASFTDAQALSAVLNGADSTTSVAVLAYQFFTGKSPTKEGLDYLVNSAGNPNDLNDPYYAKFNLENRFMNFAANLALGGQAATAFAARYGAMSYADFVASIYETIIGDNYAKAAGLDPTASIASIIARKDLIQISATSAGMITAASTPQQIDLALKTATAAYLLAEGIKADVGVYAGATNNFMLALATGTAVYNTDIVQTYTPRDGAGSKGVGHAVDNAPALPGADEPSSGAPGAARSLLLTAQNDTAIGGIGGDTFTATHLTFNAGDILTGGAGNDRLDLVATTGATYTAPGASVTGVETANISSNAGLSANTTTWAGLTKLHATSAGALGVTAGAATDVTGTATNMGAANANILGGKAVTLDVTGATTGDILIFGAKGNVALTRATTGSGDAGDITILGGGARIDVTLTGATTPSAGSTRTQGTVFIDASDATTSVKVTAPGPIADNGLHGGLNGPTVTVRDDHYGTTQAGTITTVEVDGFGGVGLGINGSALTTLKASHGTDIHIDNDDAVTSPVTTLNATLNDIHGDFKDEGVYHTLNITQGAGASEIDLQMAALTGLTVGGAGVLALTALTTPNLATVTVAGDVGLSGDLSGLAALTLIDASDTTGNVTVSIDSSHTGFTGGAGVDDVTFNSTTVSAPIDLGDGDDVLTLKPGTTTPTVMVHGGAGQDTLSMTNATAATASGALVAKFDSFERLRVTNADNTTVNLTTLGFHHVTTSGGLGMSLTGMTSGDTLVLDGAGAGAAYGVIVGASDTGNDTIDLVLEDKAGAGLLFAAGFVTSGFEHLNITTHDGSAAPAGTMERMILTGGSAAIVASGNAGLDLTVAGGVADVSDIDASALTLGGLKLTVLYNSAAAMTIKGSATVDNTIDVSAVTTQLTYTGGSGVDTVKLSSTTPSGAIDLGGGDDVLTLAVGTGTPGATIDGGAGTADILVMDGADAVAASASNAFAAKVIGFERLLLLGGGVATVDVAELGDYHYVIARNSTGMTLEGLSGGDTVEFQGAGALTTVDGADFGGANDSLNVKLTTTGGANYGRLSSTGVEHLAVTVVDPTAGSGHAWRADDTHLETIVVNGDATLNLTVNSARLNTVDASGVTLGGLKLTLDDAASAITIKGSATSENYLGIIGGVVTDVTYTGGTDIDTVYVRAGSHTIDVGQDTAADYIGLLGPTTDVAHYTTVTHLGIGDTIYFAALIGGGTFGSAVNIGGATLLSQAADLAAASTTGGVATWFAFQGDTYIVVDASTDATFDDGVDYLIKLTGNTYDLSGVARLADHFTL